MQPASSKSNPRIAVDQPAIIENGDGERVDCRVADVSQDGFRLKVPRVLPAGDGYILHLGSEAHQVEIRWASAGEVGGLFGERIK